MSAFEYHILRSTAPFGCNKPLVVGLSADGTWQVHRQVPGYAPDEAETVCGFGAWRFIVAQGVISDIDETAVCEYCWTRPEDRRDVVEYLPKMWALAPVPAVTA